MPYLIDGHNLIPRIPGLSLAAIDDEMQLVELLGKFSQHSGKQVEVFFDKAPPGGARVRRFGRVTARFVREDSSADAGIMRRLKRLGNAAANWTVVSSDRQVAAAARAARAKVLASAEFAGQLMETITSPGEEGDVEPQLGAGELEDWLRLFGEDEE